MSPFEVYLILKSNVFIIIITIVMTIAMIALVILLVFYNTVQDVVRKNELERVRRYMKLCFTSIVVCAFLRLSIPDTKQLILMYAIPAISHNKKVLNITDKSYNLLNTWLDTEISEMKKHK